MNGYYKKLVITWLACFLFVLIAPPLFHSGDVINNYVEKQYLYDLDYPQSQLNHVTLRNLFDGSNGFNYELGVGFGVSTDETWVDYAVDYGVEVLTLTNLIQNGQFTTDSNSDGLADGLIAGGANVLGYSLSNGVQSWIHNGVETFSRSLVFTQSISFTISQKYYFSFTSNNVNSLFDSEIPSSQLYISNLINGLNSFIWTAPVNMSFYSTYLGIKTGTTNSSIMSVTIFNSGSYTKSQIDTAIENYGYFEYDEEIEVVDTLDVNYLSALYSYLGIPSLSISQLDYWYNIYSVLIELEGEE